jgi:hypothetical protein
MLIVLFFMGTSLIENGHLRSGTVFFEGDAPASKNT